MLTSSYQKLDEQKEIKTLNIKENKYKYDKENEDSDTKPLLYMVEEIMVYSFLLFLLLIDIYLYIFIG